VTLASPLEQLRAHDRVWFVHPQAGLREKAIGNVSVTDSSTVLQFTEELSGVDTESSVIGLLRKPRMPVLLATACVLLIAVSLGLIHGVLIAKLKLQPFVVTLCGLLVYRGLSRWLADDQTLGFGNEYEETLGAMSTGRWIVGEFGGGSLGIPYAFFFLVIATILAVVFLNLTIWGRYILAMGRNEEAARYSGINTARITILAYVLCSLMAGAGGIMFAIDANSISPSSFGNFFELYAIAAAVLGGCSLRGGEGSILGVVVGTALMQTLYNSIVLLKIPDELEYAIIGAVILIGVVSDELLRRAASALRKSEA
jgi:ribose transport system permease protein